MDIFYGPLSVLIYQWGLTVHQNNKGNDHLGTGWEGRGGGLVWKALFSRDLNSSATLQVKVFAWSPFGDQHFRFRETFLQVKSPTSKF